MAVHLWFGRVLSVFLLVLFVLFVLLGLAGAARAGHFLTHPAATPQAIAAPQTAEAVARDARTLFEKGQEIKIKRDAKVYITPRNIPKKDRFLKAYDADNAARNGGNAAPGLRHIHGRRPGGTGRARAGSHRERSRLYPRFCSRGARHAGVA